MINEKGLIDVINELEASGGGIGLAFDKIIDIIEAQPKTWKWIPCSVRQPEMDGKYLAWNKHGFSMVLPYAEKWNCHRTHTGKVIKDSEIKDVIAWMPLPEPYKGEKHG